MKEREGERKEKRGEGWENEEEGKRVRRKHRKGNIQEVTKTGKMEGRK